MIVSKCTKVFVKESHATSNLRLLNLDLWETWLSPRGESHGTGLGLAWPYRDDNMVAETENGQVLPRPAGSGMEPPKVVVKRHSTCLRVSQSGWECLIVPDSVWECLRLHVSLWECLRVLAIVWACLIIYVIVWEGLRMCESVWECLKLFESSKGCLRLSYIVCECLRGSWNVWKCLRVS